MGLTYKRQKWREDIRKQYTEETGSADYTSPEFRAWVDRALKENSDM